MAELLRTEKLRKYFGVVSAADDIDLHIEEGLLTSIIGPNGAGKTTLINLLTGNILSDSGKVFQAKFLKAAPHVTVVVKEKKRGAGNSEGAVV